MTAVSVLRHLDYRLVALGRLVAYAGRAGSPGFAMRTYEGGCAEITVGAVVFGVCWR